MTRITLSLGAALSAVILLSACLLLSACGGGTAGNAAAAGPGVHGAAGLAAPAGAPAQGVYGAARGTVNGAVSGPAKGLRAEQTAKLAPASQSIIYTASLTLRSPDVMATAKRAIGIATAAGGYTSNENAVAGPHGRPGGTVALTLKVPVPLYQMVLAQLSSLGKQVALTQQATDVTQEVANVNSLATSEQAAITALQGLLRRAATVPNLLQVQQQISSDESSLEALQAQQRALDHETSYATVSMTLLSTQHAVVHKHKRTTRRGFTAGLAAGWRALRHATAWLLTALGVALPFLIVLAILAAAGYAGRRRLTRRRPGPTATG
jgi:hypothetical protein